MSLRSNNSNSNHTNSPSKKALVVLDVNLGNNDKQKLIVYYGQDPK